MAEVAGFNQLLQTLASMDFFTLLLPFILTFGLFFFVLKRIPLWDSFGDSDDGMPDNLAGIIAISAAFFVAYFLSQNPAYQGFFAGYFGRLTFGIVGLLGLLILLGFAGVDIDKPIPIVLMLVALALVGAFGVSGGFAPFLPEQLLGFDSTELVDAMFDTGLIYLIVIGGAIWWLVAYNRDQGGGESKIRTLVEPKN